MSEPEDEQPSLELPSLGGWRRKRRTRAPQPVAEPAPAPPAPAPEPAVAEHDTVVLTGQVADAPPAAEERRARRIRVTPRLPTGYVAVLATGVLVGLAMVALTWGSLRTCEQVQGTSSCGTAGYPMLLVVLVAAVVLGALLLRLLRIPDPVSTSFLGVGLATVLALLFLVDRLDQRPMVVVIPVLVAASYAAAHWVTTTFIEPGHRDR